MLHLVAVALWVLGAAAQTPHCTDAAAAAATPALTLQAWTTAAFEARPTVTKRACLADDEVRFDAVTTDVETPPGLEVDTGVAEQWSVIDFTVSFLDKRTNATCASIQGLIQLCVAHAVDGACIDAAGSANLIKGLFIDELNGPFLGTTACTVSAATDAWTCQVLANSTKTETALRGAFLIDGLLEGDDLEVAVKGLSFNGDSTFELSAGANTSDPFKPPTCPPDTINANGGTAIGITIVLVIGVAIAVGMVWRMSRNMGGGSGVYSASSASGSRPRQSSQALLSTPGGGGGGYQNARHQ